MIMRRLFIVIYTLSFLMIQIMSYFYKLPLPFQRLKLYISKLPSQSLPIKSFPTKYPSTLSTARIVSSRVQKVKDIITQRQILVDISSCEFALRIEVKTTDKTIDYNRLISRLEYDLQVLKDRTGIRNSAELIDRINKIKDDLNLAKQGLPPLHFDQIVEFSDYNDNSSSSSSSSSSSPSTFEQYKPSTERKISSYEPKSLSVETKTTNIEDIRKALPILVREDGTVDWDGAWASSKEVAKFGTELWERMNGKEEGIPSLTELFGNVQVREPITPIITSIQQKLEYIKSMLNESLQKRNALKDTIRILRKENKTVDESDIEFLFKLDLRVKELEKLKNMVTLDLDIERICTYLEQEIESSIDPNEQRQFVAEVALIDRQFTGLFSNLRIGSIGEVSSLSDIYVDTLSMKDDDGSNEELLSLVDDDELNLLIGEVTDLKSRLGLDTQTAFDWGSLGVLVNDSLNKLKTGLRFYGDGIKLFIRDIQYLWSLLLKAIGGIVLKPREVNAIRRTAKDILTVIPFTIILIIPLTPVGHVLAFSFIQKFFPDFFPSFFTEKRLNLKKLFSEIEYKNNENDLDELLGSLDRYDNISFNSYSNSYSNSYGNSYSSNSKMGSNLIGVENNNIINIGNLGNIVKTFIPNQIGNMIRLVQSSLPTNTNSNNENSNQDSNK